jgi:hypothetical protein
MLFFSVLFPNGNHQPFGKANFITNKNNPKNINKGNTSSMILVKKLSFLVFMFICVFPCKFSQRSVIDVFSGFSDSNVLKFSCITVFCINIKSEPFHVHNEIYHISFLSFTISIFEKSLFSYLSRKSFKEISVFSLIFCTVSQLIFVFA